MLMIKLRRYSSLPHAWQAAAFLRQHGVLARGVETPAPVIPGTFTRQPETECWVIIAFAVDAEGAAEVLDDFDALPPAEVGEWSDQSVPDLSLLPPSVTIPCSACRYDLRPQVRTARDPEAAVRCLRCGSENDAVQCVIARHGPEALLDCYTVQSPDWMDDETLTLLRVPCQRCGHGLDGLPPQTTCPECGTGFDKRAIVERSFLELRA